MMGFSRFGRKPAAEPTSPEAALINAAATLAGALAKENAALEALDLGRAADMVFDKSRALTAFEDACRNMAGVKISDTTRRQAAEILSGELQSLARKNKRLLERGMFVQKRVLALFARAAVGRDVPCYGPAERTAPVAISAKA